MLALKQSVRAKSGLLAFFPAVVNMGHWQFDAHRTSMLCSRIHHPAWDLSYEGELADPNGELFGHPQQRSACKGAEASKDDHIYGNTSASVPQIPRLCLSLNIYFQRINACGRQDLAPRQKGDTRNSNTGVQTHLCSFDRFEKALMHWCFRFWPPLCHILCMRRTGSLTLTLSLVLCPLQIQNCKNRTSGGVAVTCEMLRRSCCFVVW